MARMILLSIIIINVFKKVTRVLSVGKNFPSHLSNLLLHSELFSYNYTNADIQIWFFWAGSLRIYLTLNCQNHSYYRFTFVILMVVYLCLDWFVMI